jgi:hypothetical protein
LTVLQDITSPGDDQLLDSAILRKKNDSLTYCPHDESMNLAQYHAHLDNVRLSQERAARGGKMDGTEYRAALKAMRLSQVRAARWLAFPAGLRKHMHWASGRYRTLSRCASESI